MTVELKTIDANNPINDTMSFTSDTSIGIVRSVVSTTLSEPQYVDSFETYSGINSIVLLALVDGRS